jgi:membrane-bound lytic murein transglycosylase B
MSTPNTPEKSSSQKRKKRQRALEKQIQESRGVYYRRELDGGCVVLQSAYWLARAEQPTIAETQPEKPSAPEAPAEEGVSARLDRWLAELTHIANQSGFKRGWAAHQFKAKFGFFPPWEIAVEPRPPSDEVRAWVKERRAEYLKAKRASSGDDINAISQ